MQDNKKERLQINAAVFGTNIGIFIQFKILFGLNYTTAIIVPCVTHLYSRIQSNR